MTDAWSRWDKISVWFSVTVLVVVVGLVVWGDIRDRGREDRCRRLQAIYLDDVQRIARRVYAISTEARGSQESGQKRRYKKQHRRLARELKSKGCSIPVGED